MKNHLNEFDLALESYLAKLAGETQETRTRQAESVRVHYASPAAGLLLPLGQATATAFICGLALGVIAGLAGWPKPWAWGLLTFLITWLAAWLFLLKDWRRLVLYRLEELTRSDLNNDQNIGNPATNSTVRVEVSENNGRSLKFIQLPGTPEQLGELARGVLEGATLSESNWTPRLYVRSQFSELRTELIKRGLAAWNSPGTPARGVSLTAAGRAIFRELAKITPAPPAENAPDLR